MGEKVFEGEYNVNNLNTILYDYNIESDIEIKYIYTIKTGDILNDFYSKKILPKWRHWTLVDLEYDFDLECY